MRALQTLIVVCVLFPWADMDGLAQGQESAVASEPASKLDGALGEVQGFAPVFVRMDDQLFGRGGDYERFCAEQPRTAKRLELRGRVVKTLKGKASRSKRRTSSELERLVTEGAVRKVQHYWIVNGFACEATAEGCVALAALQEVAFVYRQRFGAQHSRKRDASFEPNAELAELYKGLLSEWRSDRSDPFDASELEVPWNLKAVGADRAWKEHGVTGAGVVVAVLDDGLMNIPALLPSLWRNPGESLNGKDDDGNGYVDDVFGYDFKAGSPYVVSPSGHRHGTLCASVVASRPFTKGEPIATGVAPRATIMPLVGSGQLRGYEYALENGADVLSMSYTFEPIEMGQYRGLFRTAHEHLAAAGIVSVGGAGNYAQSRPSGTQIGSPKDVPCVIAAAGVGPDLEVTAFSSRGPVSWEGIRFFDQVDAGDLTPAKPDVTCCNSGLPMWTLREVWTGKKANRIEVVVREDDAGYILATGPRGNSFAGPHAAGVVALLLEAQPDLPVWHVQTILASTAKDMGEPGHDTLHGAGMVQAHAAVAKALAFIND